MHRKEICLAGCVASWWQEAMGGKAASRLEETLRRRGGRGRAGLAHLQLVHQHRDGVELVIGVLRVRHNERGRWMRV